MSQLIDELNKVTKTTPQPMGFKAVHPVSSKSPILLIASLAKIEDTDRLAGSIEGADAVLLRLAKPDLTAKTLPVIAGSLPDIPWGGWLEDIDAKKMGPMVKAGYDFVVFPAASHISATPQDDKIGRILQVDASSGEGLLRTVNDLPVDAVLADNMYQAGSSISWHSLMLIQRLVNLVTKPLLVPLSLKVSASELKALWEAGIDGVVVEADARQPGRLKELRQAIDKLPPRSSRKHGKAVAMLPHVGMARVTETKPEEEDEEEEEEDYE